MMELPKVEMVGSSSKKNIRQEANELYFND
jgi:hypothetical protein